MKITTNPPDGPADASLVLEPEPEGRKQVQQLMVSDDTRWEDLETELQRIESGKCMLCEQRSESLICERYVPREV